MGWLFENPVPLFVLGLFAQLILGIILWQTGRGWVMFLMIGLAIVNIALVVLERTTVTPKEEVAQMLDDLGKALETNDLNKIFEFVSPSAQQVRQDAQRHLKSVVINEATVAGELNVQFEPSTDPKAPGETAIARFVARIRAKFLKDTTPYEQLAQRFVVYLRKENGRWLVTQYEMNRR